MIDHTLLAPTATPEDIGALCEEAVALGVGAVCVSPRWVHLAALHLSEVDVGVATVVGFPSGAHSSVVKAFEAGHAVLAGADEVDMVIPIGDALAGRWARVEKDVAKVRDAVDDRAVLKVIVESATLDDEQLALACSTAVAAGADYVKTSTGFHPAGGATVEAVRIMRVAVGPDVGIKASGGIRDAVTARAMIAAGATRIGASASAEILAGFDQ